MTDTVRRACAAMAIMLVAGCAFAEGIRPKIVVRYDFEDGKTGGMEASGGGKLEITEGETFDGTGKALKSVNDRTYLGVSFYQRKPIVENGTTVCFAYRVSGIKGDLMVQCNAEGAGNLHAAVKPTVHGKWAVGVVDLGKLVDWGGKHSHSKGFKLKNVQIYGGIRKGKSVLLVDNVVVFDGKDSAAPEAPEGLTGEITDYRVKISWRPAYDDTFVAEYAVYRGTTPDFEPRAENLVGRTRSPAIEDDTISNFGTFYYRAKAVDAFGNAGRLSEPLALKVVEE